MEKSGKTSSLTSIGIDRTTNKLIDKLCKRYSLKKGEIVKLTFQYIDKACINPAEAPESTKAELSKINKRQDDIIRFIRHYEENQLNPMIRVSHSIATRFDNIAKSMEEVVLSHLNTNKEKEIALLQKLNEQLGKHAEAINNQAKLISTVHKIQQKDNKKQLQIISLYSELAICGVMDGKRKESLKAEISNLVNEK